MTGASCLSTLSTAKWQRHQTVKKVPILLIILVNDLTSLSETLTYCKFKGATSSKTMKIYDPQEVTEVFCKKKVNSDFHFWPHATQFKHPWNIYIYMLYISMVSAAVGPENDPKCFKYTLKYLFQIFSSTTHSCICFFVFFSRLASFLWHKFCLTYYAQIPSHSCITNLISFNTSTALWYTHTHTHTHTYITCTNVCVDMCLHSLACEMQNSCAKTDRQMRLFP